jgi:oxaloacetate decarboxylase alpha subunit
MDLERIKRLSAFMDEKGLEEVEFEDGEVRIRIKKGPFPFKEVEEELVEEEEKKESNIVTFKSPLVGIFYRGPEEGGSPYVKIGDPVEPGTTLCNIQVIGMMNPIASDLKGEIVDVLVENGHPVEYGQGLFMIRVANP